MTGYECAHCGEPIEFYDGPVLRHWIHSATRDTVCEMTEASPGMTMEEIRRAARTDAVMALWFNTTTAVSS